MSNDLSIADYLKSLTEDELIDVFYEQILSSYTQRFRVKGVIDELISYCKFNAEDPAPGSMPEQIKSWKRDYEKFKKLKLEN